MSWARFDDNYTMNPKILAAGYKAELLDIRAIIWCARSASDGFVSAAAISVIGRQIPKVKDQIAKLIEVGRWEAVEGGWNVLNYLDFNPSKAEIQFDKINQKKRREVYSTPGLVEAIRERDKDRCRYCGVRVSWKDRRGPMGATYDHVIPVTRDGGGDLDNLVTACRRCNSVKGARTPEEAGMNLLATLNASSSELDAYKGTGSLVSQEIKQCELCDSNGWILDYGDEGAQKCTHERPDNVIQLAGA